MPLGQAAQILVIGDHRDHFDRQRAGTPAMQNAVEAMPLLRHGQHGTTMTARLVELPAHAEARPRLTGKGPVQLFERRDAVAVVVEYRAHERYVGHRIVEMLRLGDQAVVRGKKARHCRDNAGGIGTLGRKHEPRRKIELGAFGTGRVLHGAGGDS